MTKQDLIDWLENIPGNPEAYLYHADMITSGPEPLTHSGLDYQDGTIVINCEDNNTEGEK